MKELLVAFIASEQPLPAVVLCMDPSVCGCRATRVKCHMLRQSIQVAEALPTHIAAVWLPPRMIGRPMKFELQLGEVFSVWLIHCMDPGLVVLQHPLLRERFVAGSTFVRRVSLVSSEVTPVADDGEEGLPADVAGVRFLVSLKMTPELLCRL